MFGLVLCLVWCFCASSRLVTDRKQASQLPKYHSRRNFIPQNVSQLAKAYDLQRIIALRGGVIQLPSVSFPVQKFLLQAALTSLNIVCWSLPLRSKRLKANKHVLGLANAFAGGIFLMLSFSHLIPESISSLSSDKESGFKALYYVLSGFIAMLFVEKVAFDTEDHDEDHVMNNLPVEKQGHFQMNSAIILCLAMSIHSFFEAAALGICNSRSSAYLMAACIGLHQPAESLALVIAFLKSNMSTLNIVISLALFSTVALIGNLAGQLVHSIATPTVEALILAATAGTFIYVGATEIVSEEFEGGNFSQKLQKFVAYIAGMAAMLYITKTVNVMESHI